MPEKKTKTDSSWAWMISDKPAHLPKQEETHPDDERWFEQGKPAKSDKKTPKDAHVDSSDTLLAKKQEKPVKCSGNLEYIGDGIFVKPQYRPF
jgi:hypothetical protein